MSAFVSSYVVCRFTGFIGGGEFGGRAVHWGEVEFAYLASACDEQ